MAGSNYGQRINKVDTDPFPSTTSKCHVLLTSKFYFSFFSVLSWLHFLNNLHYFDLLRSQIATFSLFCTVMSPTLLFTYIKKIPGHLRTHLVSLLICSTTAYGLSRVTMMYYPHVKTYPHYRLFLDDDIYERFWFKRSIVVYTTIIAIVHLHTILITTSQLGWQTLLYVCTIGTLGLRTFVNFRDYMVPFLIIRLTAAPPSPKVLMVDLFLYACMATSDFYLGPFRYQAVSM